MILADTSVWIDHFRGSEARLRSFLEEGVILMHPFILGELACGNLRDREKTLGHLRHLPAAVTATDDEVLTLIEQHKLHGRGLGWIDVHLLTAARLSACRFWTLDKKLEDVWNAMSS